MFTMSNTKSNRTKKKFQLIALVLLSILATTVTAKGRSKGFSHTTKRSSFGCNSEINGKCRSCKDGYRLVDGECESCKENGCKTCEADASTCTACDSGYFTDQDKIRSSNTPSGSVKCSACLEGCSECENPDICIKCRFMTKMEEEGKKCVFSPVIFLLVIGGIMLLATSCFCLCVCCCIWAVGGCRARKRRGRGVPAGAALSQVQAAKTAQGGVGASKQNFGVGGFSSLPDNSLSMPGQQFGMAGPVGVAQPAQNEGGFGGVVQTYNPQFRVNNQNSTNSNNLNKGFAPVVY